MFCLSKSITTAGKIPEPLSLKHLLDRDALNELADEVYDTKPNLVARLSTKLGPVVVKWFGWRHPIHYYLSISFKSRAQTSWDIAHKLISCGARTPEPLFVYTKRQQGFIKENITITRAIHTHQTVRRLLKTDVQKKIKVKTISDLALSISRMHNAGILHRDLTTGNFLVNEIGDVYIVDLNRAKCFKKLSVKQRLHDLKKLYFKQSEDLEFNQKLLHQFFDIYERESSVSSNWVQEYSAYRKRLLRRRRAKRYLRRAVGRKQTNSVGM